MTRSLPISLVFKASFDKANRTSVDAYRGPGLDRGLQILTAVQHATKLPVTTDIHESGQAAAVGAVCELIQIPAFLARQTDLLVAAARTKRAVHVKKGQFLAPWDMQQVAGKLLAADCRNLLLCERGTFFGYGRLVNDMRALIQLREIGAIVDFHDPHIGATHRMRHYDLKMRSIEFSPETLASYDCVIIVTHHTAYDWQVIANHAKLIVDTRGALRGVSGPRAHIWSA